MGWVQQHLPPERQYGGGCNIACRRNDSTGAHKLGSVIASEAWQSLFAIALHYRKGDSHVATLLGMTERGAVVTPTLGITVCSHRGKLGAVIARGF